MHTYSQVEVKSQVNQIIQQVIEQQKQRAEVIDAAYGQLWQEVGTLIMAGGKRIRPYLTYLTYASFSGKSEEIFAVAAAQEFLHFALLIHDDIIDRDTIRYGRKNIMGKYETIYTQAAADASHFASGAALIAGDLALSQAYTLINQTTFVANKKAEAMHYLSAAIFEVAGGELLDMEAAFQQPSADYFKIARYKTASYSFIYPLLTGATLASAPADTLEHLRYYGSHLGIAYQLSDDLLGLYGDEESIGKPVISDLREGKKTHLFELIQQSSNEVDRNYFNQVWGNPGVTMEDVERVRQIGLDTDAKSSVEELMRDYAHQALKSLEQLKLSEAESKPFRELADGAVNRSV